MISNEVRLESFKKHADPTDLNDFRMMLYYKHFGPTGLKLFNRRWRGRTDFVSWFRCKYKTRIES